MRGYAGPIVWFVASAGVCGMTVQVWRSSLPVPVRMGALVIGSTLVSPHLNVYDASVIAAPLVSLSGWLDTQAGRACDLRRHWYPAIYALFVLLFVPTAQFMVVQLSPLVLLVLMYMVWRMAHDWSLDANVEANVRVATVQTTP